MSLMVKNDVGSLYRLCWLGQAFWLLNQSDNPVVFAGRLQRIVGLMQQIAKKAVYLDAGLLRLDISAYVEMEQGVETTDIMSNTVPYRRKYAIIAAALLATGSLALSPVVVPAFAAKSINKARATSQSWLGTFTPSGVDSRLAAKFASKARNINGRFPFTPAGVDAARSRTMTVAARTDSPLTAGAVSIRNAIGSVEPGANKAVRLTATDYRLTASRGWQGFVLPTTPKIAAPAPLSELGKGNFRLDDKGTRPSRFNTDIKLDQNRGVAQTTRGASAVGDYSLNVGGSFSISRKIDVTAGVRYASERDRVIPAADDRKDSEAVYVGTKIRF
jgi:hypothetical protein